MKKICFAAMAVMVMALNVHAAEAQPLRPANWETLDLDAKVEWLVAQMTLEEKVEQLNIQPDGSKKFKGLGSRSQIWNRRLGIGPILATNGPRGPRPSGDRPANRATDDQRGPVSPTGLAVASTWNPEIQQEVGQQWGLLVKEYGLNALWGPGVNIIKDPRAGRNTDYASEDPYLTGAFGMATTKGIQSVGVAATIKHLVANNWESGRQSHDVHVPMRPLREIYFPGFRIPVEEGDAMAIMTCYNALNGEWGSANKWLLTDVVRNEWGFEGFFVTDWGAQIGSVAQFITSGQNIQLPGQRDMNFAAVEAALKRGEVSMVDIDARVGELLRLKLDRLTYFGDETPSGYRLEDFSDVMRRAGGEAVVLLKNDDSTLPLKSSQSVALIGPFADNDEYTIGNAGSSTVHPSYVVTVKDALEARGISVNYEQGGDDGYLYKGTQFKTAFPCKIDFFNGLDPAGPVVHSVQSENLILDSIKAGGITTQTISDGFNGSAIRSSGKNRMVPMTTPDGAWTVRVQVRLEDQLPSAGRSIIRFFSHQQVLQVSSSEFLADVGGRQTVRPLNWDDMDKRWVELVVAYDGDRVSVYRDGTLLTQVPDVGRLHSKQIIFGYNNQGLPMDVDELQVWNSAWTPAQLAGVAPLATESFEAADALVEKEPVAEHYKVVAGGALEGAKMYTDRPFVYQTVPETIRGFDLVQLPIEDRTTDSSNPLLELILSRPATVQVGFDARGRQVPEWLKSWKKTGETVLGANHLKMELYAREFPAGPVILNGGRANGADAMYVVFASKGALAGVKNSSLSQGAQAIANGIPGIRETRNMSLRATGLFTPERPEKVEFQVESCGGARVFIDGKLVYDLNDEQKAKGTKNQFWHIFPDTKPHPIVVEYSSKQKYGNADYLRFLYAQPAETPAFEEAVAAAKASDVAVVCVGTPSDQQQENIDRPRFELSSWQDELIMAVQKANPKTVVVLFTVGGVDVRPWIESVPAALEAFHPGSEGGNIITDVLYGDVNPSGRLTVTWPKGNDDLPASGPNPHYKDTINEFGYRYFEANGIEPMFPFGYGLSYTTFDYKSLNVKTSNNKRYPATAEVTLKNTGDVAGKEVVQIYVSDLESSVEQAVKELGGFAKVELKPGETKTVSIPLHWTAFQFFDVVSNHWKLEPGDFKIIAARSAADPQQETLITLENE
jgi:beta-glucosidase-like glycosyl hydrolase